MKLCTDQFRHSETGLAKQFLFIFYPVTDIRNSCISETYWRRRSKGEEEVKEDNGGLGRVYSCAIRPNPNSLPWPYHLVLPL